MGHINYAVPATELDATASRFVRQLVQGAPMAIQLTKAAANIPLRQAVQSVLESALAYESLTLHSADVREGVASFLERREAIFTGT
jgi:enoyl-CoA hydratase